MSQRAMDFDEQVAERNRECLLKIYDAIEARADFIIRVAHKEDATPAELDAMARMAENLRAF